MGCLLLASAVFLDPLGSAPDSGVMDLGQTGTRWLLGALGGAIVASGIWKLHGGKMPNRG
jgi:hypothetical protein